MTDTIQQFIEAMLKKAGLTSVSEDFKNEYVAKLSAEAQRRLGIMALAALDEKAIKDFEKLTVQKEAPKQKELLAFFESRISDFPKKVSETLKQFAEEFIQGAERLRSAKVNQ